MAEELLERQTQGGGAERIREGRQRGDRQRHEQLDRTIRVALRPRRPHLLEQRRRQRQDDQHGAEDEQALDVHPEDLDQG